jgi:preprotein translocase subunit SecD
MTQQSPPPPYGAPPQRNRGPLVLVGVLALVLVAVLAVGGVLLVKRLNEGDPEAAAPGYKPAAPPSATKPASPDAVEFRRVLKAEAGGCASASPAASDPTVCGLDGYKYVLGKVELDGNHVAEVQAAQSTDALGWHVNLTLDDQGAKLFATLTTDLSTKNPPLNQLAIVVRGKVAAAPTVMSPITGGKLQITGNYTKDKAEELTKQITG